MSSSIPTIEVVMSRKPCKPNSVRLCNRCKKYVFCTLSVGSCGIYTMRDHLESTCEANRTPCTKCGILLNNDEVAVHLSDHCVGNAVACEKCGMLCYQGRALFHTMYECKK